MYQVSPKNTGNDKYGFEVNQTNLSRITFPAFEPYFKSATIIATLKQEIIIAMSTAIPVLGWE